MKIIMLGAPGAGKGTQADKICAKYNIPHISTGDIFRANIKNNTELGQKAKSYMDKGELVPDELVVDLVVDRIKADDCANGYVLDGYPRSLEQAKMLEEINKNVDKEAASFKAIYFDIDTQILIERIIYRESCPVCGEIYNKKFKPSKVAGKCDKCNVDLKTRADDNEETAKLRFETYFNETAPLVKFYEDKGVLYKIDANGSIDEVWERLLKVVNA